jgi:hypothetical protein
LRLIRLIRIIKLYKYAAKSSAEGEEARLREMQKSAQSAQQAALKRELEPTRLGKALSDCLTRRLIVSVLLMLMVLPAITYNGNDISYQYGIRELFWYGRSSCHKHQSADGSVGGDFLCHET